MVASEEPLDSNSKQEEQDETLKSTEDRQDIAGQGIAAGEVKAVSAPPERKSSSRSLLLLLLLVAVAAAGYYFYGDQLLSVSSSLLTSEQQPKLQPKRYTIERRVATAVAESENAVAPTAESVSSEDSTSIAVEPLLNEESLTNSNSSEQQEIAEDQLSDAEPSAPDGVQSVLAAAGKTAVETSAAEDAQTEPIKQLIEKTPDKAVVRDVPITVEEPVFRILVGPYLTRRNLTEADRQLQELGFTGVVGEGRGPVFLTRLIEGVYPRSQAMQRVQELQKQLGDAFLLPSAGEWAVCVGSFVDPDRAAQYGKELIQKGITITTVSQDVEINGKMLIIEQRGKPAAERVAAKLKAAGYRAAVKTQ